MPPRQTVAGRDVLNHKNLVLVVDDDEAVAKYAVVQLRRRGYRAEHAGSGQGALDSIARELPDVVVLDHFLPDMTGEHVLAALRENDDTRLLPVIYLTMDGSRARFRKSMTSGADDFLAKPFKAAELADAVAAQLRKSYARMIPHREATSGEEEVRHLADEMRDLESRLATAYAERQSTQLELTVLNATINHRVARKTRMLEHQNSALKAYSHAIAHELRKPLRGILGFAGVLMDEHAPVLPADCRELLTRIQKSGGRMNEFIEGLLVMAESERTELNRAPVDHSTMAAEIVAAGESPGAAPRGDVCIVPGLVAQSDPVLARIVLENLLSNALKYSSRGAHPVVEFDACEINGEQVFFVRDNGAGFDMKWAERLFQPFQRLHSTADYEGLGIGLATVERIIARHQGRIWAKGEPGEGATFFFTLGPSG